MKATVTTLETRPQRERAAVQREVRRDRQDHLLELRQDHLLELALAGDSLTVAEVRDALRAAYRWGEQRGYRDGYGRSFDVRHHVTGPSLVELRRRRGEDPATGELLLREGDYQGGPVVWDMDRGAA